MTAASMESCRFVAATRESFGVGLHVRKRLHRMRPGSGIIDRFSHHCGSLNHELLGNGFQSPRRARALAYAVQATTHHQTYPERPPGADLPPKKVCNLDPMAPRSRQKRQLPEGPQES